MPQIQDGTRYSLDRKNETTRQWTIDVMLSTLHGVGLLADTVMLEKGRGIGHKWRKRETSSNTDKKR